MPVVTASTRHLWLAEHVRVDYRDVVARAGALDESGDDGALTPSALARDLLPDWYEDWLLLERERFRQLRLHTLETLSGMLTRARRFGDAVQAALQAIAGEPLRESAHRRLVEAHLAEGNPVEALRQFHTFERLLGDDLGLQPSSALQGLVSHLVR
jgi:DNA-binding SARP family transcriptional activator